MNHVVIHGLSADQRWARAAVVAISNAIRLPVGEVSPLVAHLPVTLPKRLSDEEARELKEKLASLGARAEVDPAPSKPALPCSGHASLEASTICSRCNGPICAICALHSPKAPLCAQCSERARRSRGFQRIRVGILLAILAVVLLWAWHDTTRRRARNEWDRTLTVAVVILRRGDVDPEALASLRTGTRALQDRLADEYWRYRTRSARPFELRGVGPIDVAEDPPVPAGATVTDLARYTYRLWRYLRRVDALAGPQATHADMAIYVVARPPKSEEQTRVEGTSQQGGKVGIVKVELDPGMVDFALFVTAHELFHTLGATDKYDPVGRTLIPDGLAEPSLSPLYPQKYAEIMSRNVVISATKERPPESLDELRVNPITAREIGWLR